MRTCTHQWGIPCSLYVGKAVTQDKRRHKCSLALFPLFHAHVCRWCGKPEKRLANPGRK